MPRVGAIDAFRGLAIVGMVFFTIIARLSDSLPWALEHNISGAFRIGDWVLPFFLFASGMSMAYFFEKRKGQRTTLVLDSIERMGKILGVGFLFSVFSTGHFFGMDELVLNGVLFPLVAVLAPVSMIGQGVISLVIFLGYMVLQYTNAVTVFDEAYLGGYAGAVFYLPVMLAGMALAKTLDKKGEISEDKFRKIFWAISLLLAVFLFLTPLDKMRVTPSFMLLAIATSMAMFFVVARLPRLWALEYLGKRALRYWALMFIVFIIPHTYCFGLEECPRNFGLSWPTAMGISAAFLVFFAILSYGIDKGIEKVTKGKNVRKI